MIESIDLIDVYPYISQCMHGIVFYKHKLDSDYACNLRVVLPFHVENEQMAVTNDNWGVLFGESLTSLVNWVTFVWWLVRAIDLSCYRIVVLSYCRIVVLSYCRVIVLSYYRIIVLSCYRIVVLSYCRIV